MALDLAGPTEGSRGLPLSAVSPGDAVGTRLPAEAVSHRAGDPEGMNSRTICRLPVCRSGPAGRAGPALRAGRVGAPHVAPGPTSRARHREAGDVPAGTRSRSGSLRGPRWSGRKQASPVGRDSAPLWGLSRGFSEVRLPRGCRRPGRPSKSSSQGPRRPPSSPLHLAHPPRCARPSSCGRKPRAAGASAWAPGCGFPSARGLLATRLPHSAPSAPQLARPRAEGAARAPHAAGWAGGGHPAPRPHLLPDPSFPPPPASRHRPPRPCTHWAGPD